ncbi:MAG: excinuclease ABC subunit UvrA [Saprospiraceae bacterium]|nr:excinuclease ABC subunit UvrA [Saprospiraceae bacterium]
MSKKNNAAQVATAPNTPPQYEANPIFGQEYIEVIGAKVHNLKNVNVRIPRHQLVVITGISGSGKSSLAFDTIYAEGQRRYMETFSSYARQFIGSMERPDVEQITGLSPVISIEQKTVGRNPRSTVGTITEIYDFMRLLYARIGEAYSYATGEKMVKYTEEQIQNRIFDLFSEKKIMLLAPLVRGRKGHYRELFDGIRKQGYTKVRVDGVLIDLEPNLQVDRFKTHDIEVVIDRLQVGDDRRERLVSSLGTALKMGNGIAMVIDVEKNTAITVPKNSFPKGAPLEREEGDLVTFSKHLMDPVSGISYEEPSPNTFSFNSPYGSCPHCKGLGQVAEVDLQKVMPDKTKSINDVGIVPFGEVRENSMFQQLRQIAKRYNFTFSTPIKDIPETALNVILYGGENKSVKLTNAVPQQDLNYFDLASTGLAPMLKKWYEDTSSEKIASWAEDFMTVGTCPECDGFRLKKESLSYKLAEKNIGELSLMDMNDLGAWFDGIDKHLTEKQKTIAKDILKEIRLRIGFLLNVGLDYLTLNRPAGSLSGGESQRIRLATQIGSQLTGITYILDEPSIGLHQRDNERLIEALRQLRDIGNSVLVVEHDKDIMMASDYLMDLGPGAGKHGGELVGEGTPSVFVGNSTLTAEYLNNVQRIEVPKDRRKGNGKSLILRGATGNNLKNVSVTIPLGTLTMVTGVSGSGKSTLINDTLYPILRQHFYNSIKKPMPYEAVEGLEHLDKVIEIDQSPIGRTPRSNPATYTGVFSDIRNIFASLPEAKIRGYKPGRFSFNVKGGRCETCEGGGRRVIEMNFLPDVQVDCETCMGRRYNRETLEVLYKGKSINDVLNMTVEEAVMFFENIPNIYRKMKTLLDVGLGYITLGQQATTLSGGEAQRVKLAEELSKKDTGNTMYILDEPTTGLHFEDIQHLLVVLQRLVAKGNTVVVIEHNMDVIKVGDYVIDMGLEGGFRGGEVIVAGTPEDVAAHPTSHTGRFLKLEL